MTIKIFLTRSLLLQNYIKTTEVQYRNDRSQIDYKTNLRVLKMTHNHQSIMKKYLNTDVNNTMANSIFILRKISLQV